MSNCLFCIPSSCYEKNPAEAAYQKGLKYLKLSRYCCLGKTWCNQKAYECFVRATDTLFIHADAEYNLGCLLGSNQTLKKTFFLENRLESAIFWLKQAREHGHPDANEKIDNLNSRIASQEEAEQIKAANYEKQEKRKLEIIENRIFIRELDERNRRKRADYLAAHPEVALQEQNQRLLNEVAELREAVRKPRIVYL